MQLFLFSAVTRNVFWQFLASQEQDDKEKNETY